MFEIDEKHRKQMDSIALISTCRECGHVGLNKNGTRKSGRSHRLLMYVCGNCNKVYSEIALTDLMAGQPDDPENVSSRTRGRDLSSRPSKQASEKLPTTEKSDLWKELLEARDTLGEEAAFQKLHEKFVLYDKSQEPEPEEIERLHCPGCGKPMQRRGKATGSDEQRWRCNTKGCEFYTSSKLQSGWEKIIEERG